jgi:hypothetical protein
VNRKAQRKRILSKPRAEPSRETGADRLVISTAGINESVGFESSGEELEAEMLVTRICDSIPS